jgi:glutathione S-transferase
VPVLIRENAPPLFDSDVICAYFDTLHDGPKLIPTEGEARWQALRLQAVAQGLADAGIAVRWETVRRPRELRYPPLAEGQTQKLICGYDWLERGLDLDTPLHVGHIAVATTLSWLEFRELPEFRSGRPRLARWFDAFSARKSMLATPLSGETHD